MSALKMKRKRCTKHLPEDLMVEILSRVPAVSLARVRSTSKAWNALVKDGTFAKKHSANAQRQSRVILLIDCRVHLLSVDLRGIHENVVPSAKVTGPFNLKDPLSSFSEEVDIHGVFHCEGLLLCTTKDRRLVIWNPCSGETRWIQPRSSYKESDYYAIGYDNKSSCYKILRMDPFGAEYEVYDFTSNSWRGVGKTRDWFISRGSWCHGISHKGATYWLACSKDGNDILISFDFSTERFQTLSLPPDAPLKYWDLFLSVTREDQQLCMLVTFGFNSFETNVWMATRIKSTGALSWTKFLTLLKTDFPYDLRSGSQFSDGMSFLVDQENKVVLSCNKPSRFSNDIIHSVGEEKYIEVDLHGAKSTERSPTPLLLSYVPSFVQIQQDI